MHILAGLIALLGTVAVIAWRLHIAAQAARDVGDGIGELRSYLRTRSWKRKFAGNALETIDDPRIAATAMMVAIAQADGALTAAEEAEIKRQAETKFQIEPDLATELLAHARWAVKDVRDPDYCLQKLTPVIRRTCGSQERGDLLEMLRTVGSLGSNTLSPADNAAIASLRNRLAT